MSFVGCSSSPTVYDSSIPREQRATLTVSASFITSFNGVAVNWGRPMASQVVEIPAGTHNLTLSNSVDDGRRVQSGSVDVVHTFLPGHSYLVSAPIMFGTIYARIFSETELNRDLVPNTNNPNATPLEGRWISADGNIQLTFENDQVSFVNRSVRYRGTFTFNTDSVNLSFDFLKSGNMRWQMLINPMRQNMEYNGDIIIFNRRTELRKQ